MNKQTGRNLFRRYFTREGRLVAKFIRIKKEGRQTPAVFLRGEQGCFQVMEAPTHQNKSWTLYGDKRVSTQDIQRLGTARELAGYD